PAGAAGRQKTRQQGRHHQDENHHGEGQRIGGPHSFHLALQQARRYEGRGEAYTDAGENHSQALPQDQSHAIASGGPERHAYRSPAAPRLRYNLLHPGEFVPPSAGEITHQLEALRRGDRRAESILVELVYDDLHACAQQYMRRERPDHTLQPTALVHEAFLKLLRHQTIEWQDRAHFLAVASVVMRRILVDHARRRRAGKRFGAKQQVELDDRHAAQYPHLDRLLVLDEALTRLSQMDPRQGRLVELR